MDAAVILARFASALTQQLIAHGLGVVFVLLVSLTGPNLQSYLGFHHDHKVQWYQHDKLKQGHTYPDPGALWKPGSLPDLRSPLVLVAALVVPAILVLGTALVVLSVRHLFRLSPKHVLQRVKRYISVLLKDYLLARFRPDEQVIMFTRATCEGTPNYVPQARNWDAKRAELSMDDSLVVLCLDPTCLDKCKQGGLRAYGGYLMSDLLWDIQLTEDAGHTVNFRWILF
ncbi:hypothetical protein JCM10450v2_000026 [Rhodotorula kratochvilovae]